MPQIDDRAVADFCRSALAWTEGTNYTANAAPPPALIFAARRAMLATSAETETGRTVAAVLATADRLMPRPARRVIGARCRAILRRIPD
jgi:hypothetical protein